MIYKLNSTVLVVKNDPKTLILSLTWTTTKGLSRVGLNLTTMKFPIRKMQKRKPVISIIFFVTMPLYIQVGL